MSELESFEKSEQAATAAWWGGPSRKWFINKIFDMKTKHLEPCNEGRERAFMTANVAAVALNKNTRFVS